jgi:hypothetical protein
MAGAAIGVVVLFLAAASFEANANTDSNDGEFVQLLLVGFLSKDVSRPHIEKRWISSWFSLVCAAINGCDRCVLFCPPSFWSVHCGCRSASSEISIQIQFCSELYWNFSFLFYQLFS